MAVATPGRQEAFMSRVEPKDDRDQIDRREKSRNQNAPRESSPSPNPSKSEGDENTVDEALRREGRDLEH